MNAACTSKAAKYEEWKRQISEGNEGAIKTALGNGFKVNSKDYLGRTLLMFAAEEGQTEIVKILIAAGAKLDRSLLLCSLRVAALQIYLFLHSAFFILPWICIRRRWTNS